MNTPSNTEVSRLARASQARAERQRSTRPSARRFRRQLLLLTALALAFLWLVFGRMPADAAVPQATAVAAADTYVNGLAGSLNAYAERLGVERTGNRLRVRYYLRWRDQQGRLCKFRSQPRVVENLRTGRVQRYGFEPVWHDCYA